MRITQAVILLDKYRALVYYDEVYDLAKEGSVKEFLRTCKNQVWIIIMEVADMRQRDFVIPTEEEIDERRNMYAKAEELGIDLLKFDDKDKETGIKRDIRKAIIFLGKN